MKRLLSIVIVMVMLLSSSINITVNAGEAENVTEEAAATERIEDEVIDTETAEAPSVVTERGMQFKIENLQDVKSIRYAYGEYETEKDIKYGIDSVSHSAKTLRTRGDSCTLQFPKPGLVSIVITYNDGTRDFHKYDVIKSEPVVTRDGGNSITFSNLSDLKVLRYVKGEYDISYDIKRASGSVAVSGKTLDSDTYTVELEREIYTFCVQYNDESYNYYVTGICGDNLTWIYDMQSATLTVSGEGEMENYGYNKYPWSSYSNVTEKLIVGEGITNISDYAFGSFEKLSDISLSSTLESIKIGGFENCLSLKNVILPDNVTYLGSGAFAYCVSLESIDLGDGLVTVRDFVFYSCKQFKELHFPDSIETICTYMSMECPSLGVITLPDKGIYIEESSISGAYFDNPDNAKDCDEENGLYYVGNHLICATNRTKTIQEIRPDTRSVAAYAFDHYIYTYILVPDSVLCIARDGLAYSTCIVCTENSYAHKYALENGYDYKLIN